MRAYDRSGRALAQLLYRERRSTVAHVALGVLYDGSVWTVRIGGREAAGPRLIRVLRTLLRGQS